MEQNMELFFMNLMNSYFDSNVNLFSVRKEGFKEAIFKS